MYLFVFVCYSQKEPLHNNKNTSSDGLKRRMRNTLIQLLSRTGLHHPASKSQDPNADTSILPGATSGEGEEKQGEEDTSGYFARSAKRVTMSIKRLMGAPPLEGTETEAEL